MQYTDIKFEPVAGTNGKPLEFNETEFADTHCPVIRFAFAVNGFSQDSLRDFVHDHMHDPVEPEADPLFALLNDWEDTAKKLEALAEFIRTASARTTAVASAIDEEEGLSQ